MAYYDALATRVAYELHCELIQDFLSRPTPACLLAQSSLRDQGGQFSEGHSRGEGLSLEVKKLCRRLLKLRKQMPAGKEFQRCYQEAIAAGLCVYIPDHEVNGW